MGWILNAFCLFAKIECRPSKTINFVYIFQKIEVEQLFLTADHPPYIEKSGAQNRKKALFTHFYCSLEPFEPQTIGS